MRERKGLVVVEKNDYRVLDVVRIKLSPLPRLTRKDDSSIIQNVLLLLLYRHNESIDIHLGRLGWTCHVEEKRTMKSSPECCFAFPGKRIKVAKKNRMRREIRPIFSLFVNQEEQWQKHFFHQVSLAYPLFLFLLNVRVLRVTFVSSEEFASRAFPIFVLWLNTNETTDKIRHHLTLFEPDWQKSLALPSYIHYHYHAAHHSLLLLIGPCAAMMSLGSFSLDRAVCPRSTKETQNDGQTIVQSAQHSSSSPPSVSQSKWMRKANRFLSGECHLSVREGDRFDIYGADISHQFMEQENWKSRNP